MQGMTPTGGAWCWPLSMIHEEQNDGSAFCSNFHAH